MTDTAVESALIGSLLLSPDRLREVKHLVGPESFSDETLGVIFHHFSKLFAAGIKIDEITLGHTLKKTRDFEGVNVDEMLMWLMSSVGCSANALYYAQIIAKEEANREIGKTLIETTSLIEEGNYVDIDFEEIRAKVQSLQNQGICEKTKSIRSIMKMEDESSGDVIETGYSGLDIALGGGIICGELTVLAGSPSTGKSQFAVNLMVNATKGGERARTLFICQEMDEKSIQDRIFGCMSGIPFNAVKGIRRGTAFEHTMERFGEQYVSTIEQMAKLPISIHAAGCLTVDQLSAIISSNINNVDLIIIDYLQQIKKTNPRLKDYEKVSEVSSLCMEMSGEHKVPIIGLSQFNREGYKDENKRPTIANLRDSGQLEQDAANVWLLWRDKTDHSNEVDIELNIAKNRNGQVGVIAFDYQLNCGRIIQKKDYD
jgi:replicative DNA helicase